MFEADDMADQHYSFQDYIADTPCLKELQKCVRRIEGDAHNTMPCLTKLMLSDSLKLSESKKPLLREDCYDAKLFESEDKASYNDLKDEIDNFLDKFELAASVDNMLQKVADLVGISKKDIAKEAYKIYSKYVDLYDKVTGRFDNWSAPEDDLFATQLLKSLGYDGTYPLEDADNNTEWGGVVFGVENIKAIEKV